MAKNISQALWFGITLSCPECGRGKLFQTYLKLVGHCSVCKLSLEDADSGDGPAIFVMLIVGMVCAIALVITEYFYAPDLWVHGVIQLVTGVGLSLLLLPLLKSTLINLQYYFKAKETH